MDQPETGPDLVGRISARLLAAGVDRGERLDALHLLAILDASIDTSGRVRRPLDDLAGEFDLPPLSVLRSLDHLERVGAVQRDGRCVVLPDASPEGVGGMQLAGFLDDVRTCFAADGPVVPRHGWIARGGAALVAAAAAVAVVMLAPGQATIDQPLAMRGTGTAALERVDDPAASAPDAPIARIRSTTTIAAPTIAPPPDTTVAAAAAPEKCVATSSVPDRVDCVIGEDVVPDAGEGIPDPAVVPEQSPPTPPTHERPPAAPAVTPPPTPMAPSPVPTGLDLTEPESTEGVSRTFRS